MTNQPVIFLGRMPLRSTPIAPLDAVQRAERLAQERDLRNAPTPISGGMRKALHKETARQNVLRRSTSGRHAEADVLRSYGHFIIHCRHCRHGMLYTEDDGSTFGDFRCDRCGRTF